MGDAITRLIVRGLIVDWEKKTVDSETVFEIETDDWSAVSSVLNEVGWRPHRSSSPRARRIYDPSEQRSSVGSLS